MKVHSNLFFIKSSCSIIKHTGTVQCFRSLLVITTIFLLWSPTTYSQNEVGDIHGKLTDKKLSKPIANHPVTLKIHKAGDVTEQETKTDENGNYRFGNLPLDVETHYTVSTNYDGTEYIEKDLVLSTWVPSLAIDMDISEVTDDPSQVGIKSYTLVIQISSEEQIKKGVVVVNEFLDVENLGISPFQITREKKAVGFNHDLPEGYDGFQPITPNSLTRNSTGNQIILTDPLPHGRTVIVYKYLFQANNAKLELDLSRRMRFRTDRISILIQEGINLAPHSKYFKPTKYEAIDNAVYKGYAAVRKGGFSTNKTVNLIMGTPKPKSNIGQMTFIAIAAALAGGFLVAAIFMLRRAQRASEESDDAESAPTDTGWLRKLSDADLEHARTTRLEFITLLDDAHEKQDISERVYTRLRTEQTERLTEILDQCKERDIDK